MRRSGYWAAATTSSAKRLRFREPLSGNEKSNVNAIAASIESDAVTAPTAGYSPALAAVRLMSISTIAALVLGAAGYVPTKAVVGAEALPALIAGIAIALVGAWAGVIPVCLVLKREPKEHPIGIMLGTALRFLLTLGLAVGVVLTKLVPLKATIVWVAIAQLVLLAVDTINMLAVVKAATRRAE